MGCVWLSCQPTTCIMNTTYALVTVWRLWYQLATSPLYAKHTYRCICVTVYVLYTFILCLVWCAVRDGGAFSREEIVQIALLIAVTALLVSLILTLAVCYIRFLQNWFSVLTKRSFNDVHSTIFKGLMSREPAHKMEIHNSSGTLKVKWFWSDSCSSHH